MGDQFGRAVDAFSVALDRVAAEALNSDDPSEMRLLAKRLEQVEKLVAKKIQAYQGALNAKSFGR